MKQLHALTRFSLSCRQLLAREPARPLRLADVRARRDAALGVVGDPDRRVHGPGGVPGVQLQLARRVVAGQVGAPGVGQPGLRARRRAARLRRARGRGLDRRHQPPRVGPRGQAGLRPGRRPLRPAG